MTALKIFDIELSNIEISKITHTLDSKHIINLCYSTENFNNVFMSTQYINFVLQFPTLEIIDADTEQRQIILSFKSNDILYNDFFTDFLKELNETIMKKIMDIKYLLTDKIEFINFFNTYTDNEKETDVIVCNYINCDLFYNKEKITIEQFDSLLENNNNLYCKLGIHIKDIVIDKNKAFIKWDVLHMHLKKN